MENSRAHAPGATGTPLMHPRQLEIYRVIQLIVIIIVRINRPISLMFLITIVLYWQCFLAGVCRCASVRVCSKFLPYIPVVFSNVYRPLRLAYFSTFDSILFSVLATQHVVDTNFHPFHLLLLLIYKYSLYSLQLCIYVYNVRHHIPRCQTSSARYEKYISTISAYLHLWK